jgi:perosamine synthetase
MTSFIPLASPDIRDEDISEAVSVLKSGMLVQGVKVEALEKTFSDYLQTSNAIAVSNGTATLHLALIAHHIGPGDEVIVPAFSYIATANVVELVGAKPVFTDVDLTTFNICTKNLESKITNKTKAIIPVHEFGLCSDMPQIMEIASQYNLIVIEDAACALGAKIGNKSAGTFGAFGSFSLHPRKAITSGEGGVLITANKELASKIRVLRNHGIQIENSKMEFVEAGFNYRMTDFQAALVNNQLKRLDSILDYKNRLAQQYAAEINNELITKPIVPTDRNHTWQTYHILLDRKINRDKAIETLKQAGIGTNYGAQCIPMQKYYQKKYKLDCALEFPNAKQAFEQGLAVPIYEKLKPADISYISEKLNNLV